MTQTREGPSSHKSKISTTNLPTAYGCRNTSRPHRSERRIRQFSPCSCSGSCSDSCSGFHGGRSSIAPHFVLPCFRFQLQRSRAAQVERAALALNNHLLPGQGPSPLGLMKLSPNSSNEYGHRMWNGRLNGDVPQPTGSAMCGCAYPTFTKVLTCPEDRDCSQSRSIARAASCGGLGCCQVKDIRLYLCTVQQVNFSFVSRILPGATTLAWVQHAAQHSELSSTKC